jgi:hypothetical protein
MEGARLLDVTGEKYVEMINKVTNNAVKMKMAMKESLFFNNLDMDNIMSRATQKTSS